MIAHDSLPDALIQPCLDALEILSYNERDFVRLLVEVISDLRDPSQSQQMTGLVCSARVFPAI